MAGADAEFEEFKAEEEGMQRAGYFGEPLPGEPSGCPAWVTAHPQPDPALFPPPPVPVDPAVVAMLTRARAAIAVGRAKALEPETAGEMELLEAKLDGDDEMELFVRKLDGDDDDDPPAPVDTTFGTGAVRSADGDDIDFYSMPLLGVLSVARTAKEGATKYGALNFRKGFPAHTCINRALRHLILFSLGDRSEPHLSHASWNCMVADESVILHPELNEPHLLGPGVTLTPALEAFLDAGAAERAEKRKKGLFAKLGDWTLAKVPEVARLLEQRRLVRALKAENEADK